MPSETDKLVGAIASNALPGIFQQGFQRRYPDFITTTGRGNGYYNASSTTFSIKVKQNNNTKPDNNNTDENKTTKHVSSKIVDGNATGNPIAMMLLALFVMVITYRKK